MSRLEKTIQKKYKKRKLRIVSKVLFILLMSLNLGVCIFIVDRNAKIMLGEETYNIEPVINEIQTFVNEQIRYLNDFTKDIIAQINK